MSHGKGTEQTALCIALAACAMQEAVAIAQFLCKLIVMMPSPVKTVEFAPHPPKFRTDVAVAEIKSLYTRFGHVVTSTVACSSGSERSRASVLVKFWQKNSQNTKIIFVVLLTGRSFQRRIKQIQFSSNIFLSVNFWNEKIGMLSDSRLVPNWTVVFWGPLATFFRFLL